MKRKIMRHLYYFSYTNIFYNYTISPFITGKLSIFTLRDSVVTFLAPNLPTTETLSPCTPSPCGTNALCQEQNGVGSCQCLPDYFGNPYEGCRPECTLSSDCAANLACMRMKCQNPCPGTCGQNADCQVINHLPSCTCPSGFTGDPFSYCRPYQPVSKSSREQKNRCVSPTARTISYCPLI